MEGPSLIIFKDEAAPFVGKPLRSHSGTTTTIPLEQLSKKRLQAIETWGKHLLLTFDARSDARSHPLCAKPRKVGETLRQAVRSQGNLVIKIHFLMYGSYRINETRPGINPRLSLFFKNGEIHFYSCSLRLLTEPLDTLYDWRVDIMSPVWDERYVLGLLNKKPTALLCDVLLDQTIFAGVGNIIKNEVLFNLDLHPLLQVKNLSASQRRALIREARRYSFQFYEWKKLFVLRKNWRIYRQKFCPNCGEKVKIGKTGELERRSFYCETCQAKPSLSLKRRGTA